MVHEPQFYNRRVLAVDDDELIRSVYQKMLAQPMIEPEHAAAQDVLDQLSSIAEGVTTQNRDSRMLFELSLFEQGEAAVEAVRAADEAQTPFTVALIDMRMPPGIDGLETAKRIRKIDSEIHIIFVTAHSDHRVKKLVEEVKGELLFFRKPFESDELYQTVYNSCRSWNRLLELKHLKSNLQERISLQTKRLQEKVHSLELFQRQVLNYEMRIDRSRRVEQGESLAAQVAPNREQDPIQRMGEAPNNRILAVDDDPLILRFYESCFGRMIEDEDLNELNTALSQEQPLFHFQLTTASSGEEALEKIVQAEARSEPFATIFLDMRMPAGMDGLEAARQIMVIAPESHIIFYTGYSDYEMEEISEALGDFFTLLRKPIQRPELIHAARYGCATWNRSAESSRAYQILSDMALEMESEIEARKRTESALIAARREAEEASREKDRFLSSMSHGLRTPLTSIIGYNQILLEEQMTPTQREMLGSSLSAGRVLMSLVNDILDVSNLRQGNLELNLHAFNVGETLSDMVELMQRVGMEKGVALRWDEINPPLYPLIGDEMRLTQVLYNLIDNAIKFSPVGREVRIHVEHKEQGEGCILLKVRIEDDGIGISCEDRAKLFSAYEQGDESIFRLYGGNGLGLYICNQLVSKMGGSIEIESWMDVGSTFLLQIPFRVEQEALSGGAEETVAEGIPVLQGKVLLAEDTPQIQKLTRLLVERTGAEIECADKMRRCGLNLSTICCRQRGS